MSLDDQDKQWLSEHFARIDGRFAGIDGRFAGIDGGFARIDERLEQLKHYVDERLELVETRLLTEFHKWASATDARSRTHAAAIRAIDVEMEAIDDRLKKLEGRQ